VSSSLKPAFRKPEPNYTAKNYAKCLHPFSSLTPLEK
jgi:hypothetical protein